MTINDNSTLSNNSAAINGGGIYGNAADTIAITITQSSLEDNTALYNGGGIDDFLLNSQAVLTIDDSTISGNSGINNTYGGGIDGSGTIAITNNSAIAHNSGRYGGGIYSANSLTISDSTVANNTGVYAGGIDNFGTASFTDSGLSGNSGDGINNFGTLTVSDGSTLTGNVFGPAIENFATLEVTDSTFSGNSAGDGGALSNNSGASASISSCTISGNTATNGGGIFIGSGTVTLTNSTIAGNTANSGGGIYSVSGILKYVDSTISYNVALDSSGGGGIYNGAAGTSLFNTIVALNTDGTGAGATADDIAGHAVSSSAYSLVGADETGSLTNGTDGNQVGVTNPGLGTLASNGGPTETIALLAGSPAIDAGSNALAVDRQGNPLTYDQRGAGIRASWTGPSTSGPSNRNPS